MTVAIAYEFNLSKMSVVIISDNWNYHSVLNIVFALLSGWTGMTNWNSVVGFTFRFLRRTLGFIKNLAFLIGQWMFSYTMYLLICLHMQICFVETINLQTESDFLFLNKSERPWQSPLGIFRFNNLTAVEPATEVWCQTQTPCVLRQ